MIGGGGFLSFISNKGVIDIAGSLPVWTAKGEPGWSWGAVGIVLVIGLVFLACGIGLILLMRSLVSLRIRVCQNGIAVIHSSSKRIIGWDDIQSVEEVHLYERPPILKGAAKYVLPKLMSKSFIVKVEEGDDLRFGPNSIKEHVTLAEMIKAETDRRDIPWDIVEEQGY